MLKTCKWNLICVSCVTRTNSFKIAFVSSVGITCAIIAVSLQELVNRYVMDHFYAMVYFVDCWFCMIFYCSNLVNRYFNSLTRKSDCQINVFFLKNTDSFYNNSKLYLHFFSYFRIQQYFIFFSHSFAFWMFGFIGFFCSWKRLSIYLCRAPARTVWVLSVPARQSWFFSFDWSLTVLLYDYYCVTFGLYLLT